MKCTISETLKTPLAKQIVLLGVPTGRTKAKEHAIVTKNIIEFKY